jgi:beta-glucosidase
LYENPNVTAIVWAGIPGQESGNAITDILYGKANPGGKTPFTWGSNRTEWGVDIVYEPNNGDMAPQEDFTEGVFIDYRAFDKANITPVFEFGFGLSYTTFEFSNLQIQPHTVTAYTPTTGNTPAAPSYGSIDNDTSAYVYPANATRVWAYIYPYINSTDLEDSSADPYYNNAEYTLPENSTNGNAQPYLPAGSNVAPGGNQALYDVMFSVTSTITNTGDVAGDEVPQVYVSLGGPNDPVVVLRQFDRIHIAPGASVTYTADLTRRDLSNWDTASQNWVISDYPKTVYVGCSSRKLPLSGALEFAGNPNGY